MVIDCHGHYTTVPEAFDRERNNLIPRFEGTFQESDWRVPMSDEQIRLSIHASSGKYPTRSAPAPRERVAVGLDLRDASVRLQSASNLRGATWRRSPLLDERFRRFRAIAGFLRPASAPDEPPVPA